MQKNRRNIIIGVLLMLTIVNFNRIAASGSIRTVEFLHIWVIGVLSGLLIADLKERFLGKS